MKQTLIVLGLALAMVISGCTATRGKKGSVEGTSSSASAGGSSDFSGGAGGSDGGLGLGGGESSAPGGTGDDLTGRVVYFELDSAEIKPEGLAVIDAWSKYLVSNPSAKIRLEGHCDERGTREYNIALGERRGNTVQEALTARGASAGQISISSFGEERPIALGHDEAAWSQNRRVEFVQP